MVIVIQLYGKDPLWSPNDFALSVAGAPIAILIDCIKEREMPS